MRGAGWEFVHVCVDDATRLAYVEVGEGPRLLCLPGGPGRASACGDAPAGARWAQLYGAALLCGIAQRETAGHLEGHVG